MNKRFLSQILQKYYHIIEENIKKGHYIETDFRHYSELVRSFVDAVPPENAIFFTALCLPLFQWFNFKIEPPEALYVREVDRMETDLTWVKYLKYINELKKKEINLVRCLFCADPNVRQKENFKLVKEKVLKEQCEAVIIYKKDSQLELEPLRRPEIDYILKTIGINYSSYSTCEIAYLIVDHQDISSRVNNLPNGYAAEKIKNFFIRHFHRGGHCKKAFLDQTFYDTQIIDKNLVEDFFVFGLGDIEHPQWKYGLFADVIGFKKVRLWIVSDQIDALEKDPEGEYEKRFSFTIIEDFLASIKERWVDL